MNISARPPLLTIVGRKNCGKTTLVVTLAAALRRRGHRVMTIKHGSHTFNLDPTGTDTYRHYHEGEADRVAMISPDKFALVSRWSDELSPEEVSERYMSDADVVLCEGFKASALPRIEVFRREVYPDLAPLYADAGPERALYRAIVTDVADYQTSSTIPVLRFTDPGWIDRLVQLVESDFVRPRR